MRINKGLVISAVIGAVLGGYLGNVDGSGIFIGVIAGMVIGCILYGLIMYFLTKNQRNSFASQMDEERSSRQHNSASDAPRSVSKAAQQFRDNNPPHMHYH